MGDKIKLPQEIAEWLQKNIQDDYATDSGMPDSYAYELAAAGEEYEKGAIAMYLHLKSHTVEGEGDIFKRASAAAYLSPDTVFDKPTSDAFIDGYETGYNDAKAQPKPDEVVEGEKKFLKEFGPEDTAELIKSVREVLDHVVTANKDKDGIIAIRGKKEASERIGYAHAAMLDSVYEGAGQWEERCKIAESKLTAKDQEIAQLKEERDYLKKGCEDWEKKVLDLMKQIEIIKNLNQQ